jgi:NMD3 family protein
MTARFSRGSPASSRARARVRTRPVRPTRPRGGAPPPATRRLPREQRGARDSKTGPLSRAWTYADGSLCRRCGSVFRRKTWRRRRLGLGALDRARWTTCPACRESRGGLFHGEVRLRGTMSPAQRREIVRRIRHIAERATFTQPERRLIEIRPCAGGLDLTTTSEGLAHRIGRELVKAFQGRVRYTWSDGERLLRATWESGIRGAEALPPGGPDGA